MRRYIFINGFIAPTSTSVYPVKYGFLYNWFAINDSKNISNVNWRVASYADCSALATYLSGTTVAGGMMKETGFTYWTTPNTNATNTSLFNGRGAGIRQYSGNYTELRNTSRFFVTNAFDASYAYIWQLNYSNDDFVTPGTSLKLEGHPIRIIKTSTSLTNGQSGTYTGNDGKIYRTICIGAQEWLADNLAETKYRDGSSIPEVTVNASWQALTTGALCAYDNDWTNVSL